MTLANIAWLMFGVFVGALVMALMNMARDPITQNAAGIKPKNDEINGEEW